MQQQQQLIENMTETELKIFDGAEDEAPPNRLVEASRNSDTQKFATQSVDLDTSSRN